MEIDRFPDEVIKRLKWYVYRLIDPRNGETFYVGKGKGNRVFQHAQGALSADDTEDAVDLKAQRIKDIRAAGLEVGHVIHRHGIESEAVALQIEAALIDVYPGLANRVGGHGSGDYGVRHVQEIIAMYTAQPFEPQEKLILISIARTYDDPGRSVYDAVRGFWRLDVDRARQYRLVLAHRQGIVVGAFRPREWWPGTRDHFPQLAEDEPGRFGFVGEPADAKTASLYVGRRVPDQYRAKWAANPVRYVDEVGPEPA
jgi:hypothetical protein